MRTISHVYLEADDRAVGNRDGEVRLTSPDGVLGAVIVMPQDPAARVALCRRINLALDAVHREAVAEVNRRRFLGSVKLAEPLDPRLEYSPFDTSKTND